MQKFKVLIVAAGIAVSAGGFILVGQLRDGTPTLGGVDPAGVTSPSSTPAPTSSPPEDTYPVCSDGVAPPCQVYLPPPPGIEECAPEQLRGESVTEEECWTAWHIKQPPDPTEAPTE